MFAWKADDVGEKSADYFYPISIVEKESILEKCQQIGIDGICSISSDLAVITVNYVADKMGLVGNSPESTLLSTNKRFMRECFYKNGDPSPKSITISSEDETDKIDLEMPVIVKPLDRSGSRGITKVCKKEELCDAVRDALEVGFEKSVIIEEYVSGQEYSVEYISWNGEHTFLAITQKYTTGSPNFIETAHLEPAMLDDSVLAEVKNVVEHALDSLKIRNGASHTEIRINDSGAIKLIEIGGRMGGDNIGSSLVELTTGYDYVGAVIDIALGNKPGYSVTKNACAGVRFILSPDDIAVLSTIKREHPEILVEEDVHDITSEKVTDSAKRFGYYTIASEDLNDIKKYMPINGI